MATYEDFLKSFSPDDILGIFPTGLKTAPAVVARMAAYIPDHMPVTKDSCIAAIKAHRNDPDFAPDVGHKRNAWFNLLALVLRANRETRARPETIKMGVAVDSVWTAEWCTEVYGLAAQPFDTDLLWNKDGGMKTIKVPADVAKDAEVVEWAATRWPAK